MTEKKLTATELIADAESRLVYEAVTPSLNYGEVTVKGTRYVRMPVKITDVKAPFPQFFTIETSSPFMLKITGQKPGLAVATATDETGQEWKIEFKVSKPAANAKGELLEAKLKQLTKLQAEIEKLRGPLLEWQAELYEVPVEVLKELTGAQDEPALYKSGGGKLEDGLLKKLKENKLAKRQSVPTVVSRADGKASIFSGGEMPIMVPAGDGKVAIEFRSFGLSLEATARVASDNSLVSNIRFEHSEPDYNSAVTVDGVQVPGFTVRSSEIQANMKPGETLQVIGPISERSKPVPFENPLAQAAADIGILDAKVKKTKTALVVFLTPSVVKPQKPNEPKMKVPPVSAATPAHQVPQAPIPK